MVEQTSRRAIKGEDPCFFEIALQLIDCLGSPRHAYDPSTCCMKSKQHRVREPRVLVARSECDG